MQIEHRANSAVGAALRRRYTLMMLALLAISGCSLSSAAPVTKVVASHWDYGAEGPEHWAELDSSYRVCRSGHAQSPIDLPSRAMLDPADRIGIEYGPIPSVELVNTGHTVQANPPAGTGNRILVDGMPFELVQFHFHLPGEHTVDGVGATMELHLVHRNAAGALAVLGVPMRQAPGPSAFAPMLANAPGKPGAKVTTGPIDPRTFLPADTGQFRYVGSLTTPPCSEGVRWIVLRHPVAVTPEEAGRYLTLFPHSNRPTQPLNGRVVAVSGS
ncbi:carbonic anhydrase [Nocardia sp. NPDC052566]|uniref:carbonic anhydrase n=1 Tax=Nocardia sp. NPDC052566 TaxID=3364330 RepID=UPI0037C96D09